MEFRENIFLRIKRPGRVAATQFNTDMEKW